MGLLTFIDTVYINTASGNSGITFPNGTAGQQVSNINDAISIGTTEKLYKIEARMASSLTLTSSMTGFWFVSKGYAMAGTHLLIDAVVTNCFIQDTNIYDSATTSDKSLATTHFKDCKIVFDSDSSFVPVFLSCFIEGGLVTSGSTLYLSTSASRNTFSGTYFDTATISLVKRASGSTVLNISDCHGDLTIAGCTIAGATINIYNFKGKLTIASSCTAGNIFVYGGSGRVTDSSNGASVDLRNVYKVNLLEINGSESTVAGLEGAIDTTNFRMYSDLKSINASTAKATSLAAAIDTTTNLVLSDVTAINTDPVAAASLYWAVSETFGYINADTKAIDGSSIKAGYLKNSLNSDNTINSNVTKFTGTAVVKDGNNLPSVDLVDIKGSATKTTALSNAINTTTNTVDANAALINGDATALASLYWALSETFGLINSDVKAVDGSTAKGTALSQAIDTSNYVIKADATMIGTGASATTAATNLQKQYDGSTGFNSLGDFAGGYVYYNSASGLAGIAFPLGTALRPVNNLDNALTIMSANNINKMDIKLMLTKTLSTVSTGIHFIGNGYMQNAYLNLDAAISSCVFNSLAIADAANGSNKTILSSTFIECRFNFDNATGYFPLFKDCLFKSCWVTFADIKTESTATSNTFNGCSFYTSSIDLSRKTTGSQYISIISCAGNLSVTGSNILGNTINVYDFNGTLTLSGTNGIFNIFGGKGRVVNSTSGSAVINEYGFYPDSVVAANVTQIAGNAAKATGLGSAINQFQNTVAADISYIAQDSTSAANLKDAFNATGYNGSGDFSNGIVYFNSGSADSGITFPKGTYRRPVNSIDDAANIAIANNIDRINLAMSFDSTISVTCNRKHLYGTSTLSRTLTVNGIMNYVTFERLNMVWSSGNVTDCVFRDCMVTGLWRPFTSYFVNSMIPGIIRPNATAAQAMFQDCKFEPGSEIRLSEANASCVVYMLNCSGPVRISYMTSSSQYVYVYGFKGDLAISPTCSSGVVEAQGCDRIRNNSTGTFINAESTLDSLRKFQTNKKQFERVGSDWFLVTYDDDGVTEISRQQTKAYGGGSIADLAGTKTPSIREESSI